MVTVKFFGWARDLAGCNNAGFECPNEMHAGEYWNVIFKKFPSLAAYKNSFVLAVNYEYATESSMINDGDEVAVIPPVSGG